MSEHPKAMAYAKSAKEHKAARTGAAPLAQPQAAPKAAPQAPRKGNPPAQVAKGQVRAQIGISRTPDSSVKKRSAPQMGKMMTFSIKKYPWFTKEELDNTPSRLHKNPLTKEKEAERRKKSCAFIAELGSECKFDLHTTATASTYFHIFFTRMSFQRYDPLIVASTCLFVAQKATDKRLRVGDMIRAYYKRKGKRPPAQNSEEFETLRKDIYMMEQHILDVTEYTFDVRSPFQFLKKLLTQIFGDKYANKGRAGCHELDCHCSVTEGGSKDPCEQCKHPREMHFEKDGWFAKNDLQRVAMFFISDSLRSTLCLKHHPETIALGAIYLSLRFFQLKVLPYRGLSIDSTREWHEVLFRKSRKELDEISHEILKVVEHQRRSQPKRKRNSRAAPVRSESAQRKSSQARTSQRAFSSDRAYHNPPNPNSQRRSRLALSASSSSASSSSASSSSSSASSSFSSSRHNQTHCNSSKRSHHDSGPRRARIPKKPLTQNLSAEDSGPQILSCQNGASGRPPDPYSGSSNPTGMPPGSSTPTGMPPRSSTPTSMPPGSSTPSGMPPRSTTPGTSAPSGVPPGSSTPSDMPPPPLPQSLSVHSFNPTTISPSISPIPSRCTSSNGSRRERFVPPKRKSHIPSSPNATPPPLNLHLRSGPPGVPVNGSSIGGNEWEASGRLEVSSNKEASGAGVNEETGDPQQRPMKRVCVRPSIMSGN